MKVADRAKQELLNKIIVEREYHSGEKLPNENRLAEELRVSRTSVREAIQFLVTQNVLEVRRGKGTFVTDHVDDSQGFGSKAALSLQNRRLRDIYELRYMLAPQAAYFAAKRATEAELENIIQIGKEIQEHSLESDEDMGNNEKFHMAIARATHNEFAVQLMQMIEDRLIEEFKAGEKRQVLYDSVLDDHKMIINYLKLRDADGARQAMALHMQHSMREYHIDSEEEGAV